MSRSIPQTDPKANYLAHRAGIDAAIERVLTGGRYVLGEEVSAFEREFAAWCGEAHCVGVASGTDALIVALRAAGIVAGDGVITVSHTAVATVAAIELAGAVPMLVDIDPATFTIDPRAVEAAAAFAAGAGIRLRAIVPVHLYGRAADMPAIMELAARRELIVIEDCSQAHGARCGGVPVGTFGAAATFSFYPTKNLGAIGDGGAVVTNDPAIAERARLLRQYGWRDRYVSDIAGMNSRLDELQAAILRVKLAAVRSENERRGVIAAAYGALLAGCGLPLPAADLDGTHVWHQYVVRSAARDTLRKMLTAAGVGTLVHYPVPVHLQPAYRDRLALPGPMPHTERAARDVLSLPMYPEISDEDVRVVAAAVIAAVDAMQLHAPVGHGAGGHEAGDCA